MLLRIFLFLPFFSCFLQISAQKINPALEASLAPPAEKNVLADRDSWKEIEKERAVFSSTYLTPDGRTMIHYSKEPLNYEKNGKLVPVNYKPVMKDGALYAADQPSPVIVSNSGAVITGNSKENTITYSMNARIDGRTVRPTALELDGKTAIMKNILPGLDKTFDFRFSALEYTYILNNPIGSTGKDLVIEETILLPQASIIKGDENLGEQNEKGWLGSLTIRSKSNEEIGRMRGAVCFDANKNVCAAYYKTENKNGVVSLQLIVPDQWINDASRVYPITIDPLVTGPTTTWTGGYIPSCLSPGVQVDSIQITLPAQITVTGFYVSSSYYASPFSTAVMGDGEMYFSTTCNQTTTFTVTGALATTPGTGYLSAYDLRSPLLCCRPQSCTAQNFYLRMHLFRTAGGTGCNTTYIYHDPFGGYPFQAYVEGRTAEAYGMEWNVIPNSICADVCNLTGTVYMRYGVPPYTITHPWATGTYTAGTPAGCSFSTNSKVLTLTIPGCPWICDTISMLSVPPAVVIDGCGTAITGIPPEVITVKATPAVTASPNPVTACSDIPFDITLSSCIPGSTINWGGNSSGSGTTITDTITNTSGSTTSTNYVATATYNGCTSDTLAIVVNTDPLPIAAFTPPVPIIINNPVVFTDNTISAGGSVTSMEWNFGDNTASIFQNPTHIYSVPGVYPVCLMVQTASGCVDTVCMDVNVVPAELVLPNVITPNGDDTNDLLYFQYLEFFGSNALRVYDRWGTKVYEKLNYTNDWNAKGCSDGTYYFILDTQEKSYPGYVQIIHD